MLRRSLAIAALLLALPGVALAQGNYFVFQQRWLVMDRCEKRAFDRFPEWTTESLAKRDRYARECQWAAGVPIRQPMAPRTADSMPEIDRDAREYGAHAAESDE